MKSILSIVLIAFGMSLAAQTTMNIYQSNGSVLQIPLADIDSVNFSNVPPPRMNIYQNNGTTYQVVLSDIDSITYSNGYLGSIFNSSLNYGSVTDIDGNIYKTIVIGNQEWFAENLRTTHFSNGDSIPNVVNWSDWGDAQSGAWAYYDNDNSYNYPHGKLYNWFAVADPRNICPLGWHVPSREEWYILIKHLDQDADTSTSGVLSETAGLKMKSIGFKYWNNPDPTPLPYANNNSGFSGLPSGQRNDSGTASTNIGDSGFWWSSTELNSITTAWFFRLFYGDNDVNCGNFLKNQGISCRCIKD